MDFAGFAGFAGRGRSENSSAKSGKAEVFPKTDNIFFNIFGE
jgi:hypothetical protein